VAYRPVLTQNARPATYTVDARDEHGNVVPTPIAGEHPLTLYVDKREIVTLMTLGAAPEALAIGFLRNQRLVGSLEEIASVQVDWDVNAVVVTTHAGLHDLERKTGKRTATTGCGQGTMFGDLMEDIGNVRLVGMTEQDVQDLFKLRIDDNGRVWMFPQAVIDETVKAFSVSATSTTGYGSLGAPAGRYFAPANGPDCIEDDPNAGYGKCGTGTLVVTGPTFQNYDLSIVKRIPIVGRVVGEFRVEALNVFNNVNFAPVGGIGNNADNFEVTGLTGTNVARVVQLVSRISW